MPDVQPGERLRQGDGVAQSPRGPASPPRRHETRVLMNGARCDWLPRTRRGHPRRVPPLPRPTLGGASTVGKPRPSHRGPECRAMLQDAQRRRRTRHLCTVAIPNAATRDLPFPHAPEVVLPDLPAAIPWPRDQGIALLHRCQHPSRTLGRSPLPGAGADPGAHRSDSQDRECQWGRRHPQQEHDAVPRTRCAIQGAIQGPPRDATGRDDVDCMGGHSGRVVGTLVPVPGCSRRGGPRRRERRPRPPPLIVMKTTYGTKRGRPRGSGGGDAGAIAGSSLVGATGRSSPWRRAVSAPC